MTHCASIDDSHMNQLTLRGFDQGLEERIQQLARQEHISLNKAALKLMRRGAGLTIAETDANLVGDRLNAFIGSWGAKQAEEFEAAVNVFEEIDPEQWR